MIIVDKLLWYKRIKTSHWKITDSRGCFDFNISSRNCNSKRNLVIGHVTEPNVDNRECVFKQK